MGPVSAAPRRLLRTCSRGPRLPSQPGADPKSPASSPEIELDLLGPQGENGAAPADHQPADCQQISSMRRPVTQLTTTAPALESPASTPSSSPLSTTPTLPLSSWQSQPVALFRRHTRTASITSVASDTSCLSTLSGTGSTRDPRQRTRLEREAEAKSIWTDFWS